MSSTAQGRWRTVALQWGVGGIGFSLAGLLGTPGERGADGLLIVGGVLVAIALLLTLLSATDDAELLGPVLMAGVTFASAASLAADAPPTPVAILYCWVGAQAWCFLGYRAAMAFTVYGIALCGAMALVLPASGDNALAWWIGTASSLLVLGSLTAALRLRSDRLMARLQQVADHDETTGVLNRRGFSTRLAAALSRQRRYGEPVALVLVDVDGFDALHDRFGHPGSDRVLRRFAACCDSELRGHDALGRIGGERFALLLPDADSPTATGVAERIRTRLAADVTGPDGGPVTASFGVAVSAGPESADRLLDAAAELLSAAQRDGHDLVRADTLPA